MSTYDAAQGTLLVCEFPTVKRITLNRPQSLNALSLDMATAMTALYQGWDRRFPTIILQKGSGDQAFCAGGDVKSVQSLDQVSPCLTLRPVPETVTAVRSTGGGGDFRAGIVLWLNFVFKGCVDHAPPPPAPNLKHVGNFVVDGRYFSHWTTGQS